MSILGFFTSKEARTHVTKRPHIITSPLNNQKQSYLQRELSGLKEYVRELDRKDRVSKKQRQELMARVFTTLDLAEKEIDARDD